MLKVYSKPNCPNCVKAKALLDEADIPYEVVDISTNETERQFLIAEGHRSVPQIYKNGKLFVENGYTGLVEAGLV